MNIFHKLENLDDFSKKGVVALGNFDGLHLGHQKVINTAMNIARDQMVSLSVFTFEPHPQSVFSSSKETFRLSPLNIKTQLMRMMGVQTLFVQKFDNNFSKTSANDFISDFLVSGFEALHIVVGFDFVFGNKRLGNVELLRKMSGKFNFSVSVVNEYKTLMGFEISSTQIRDYLKQGKCEKASELLGRNWEVVSKVEGGDKRGRELGYPTANLPLNEYLHPCKGVYAVRISLEYDNKVIKYNGIANFGLRPTFSKEDVLLEVHIFDFNKNIYDMELKVEFLKFIRPEKKFNNLDDLKSQLKKDCEIVKSIFSNDNLGIS